MTLTVPTPADLMAHVGEVLGPTDWVVVDQERFDRFADSTGDPRDEKYLTLSLTNLFLPDLLVVEQFSMGVNVGLDSVEFPHPVQVGDRIRGVGEVLSATNVGQGVQAVVRITIEIDGEAEAACIADTVSRFFP